MALPKGLAGFLAAQDRVRGGEMAELQQAAAVQGLLGRLQERKAAEAAAARQAEYQTELAGATTPEQRVSVASRYATPDKLIDIQQRALDRSDATAARREAIDARRENDQRMIDLRYDQLAQQAANDTQRRELETRRIEEKSAADKRHDDTLRMLGLLKNEIAANKPPKPLTEVQGKNALYGSRAAMADQTLNDLEEKISLSGLATKQAVQGIPVLGGPLGVAGNAMLSANQQKVEQAQRNFVNAVLRQESGAVIADTEFENAKKQYFPQPGDKPDVIQQKRLNRQAVIAGFKRIAGTEAWADVEEQLKAAKIPAAVPPTGGVPEFASEAEAAAAAAAGKIKAGDKIKVGGKQGTWR